MLQGAWWVANIAMVGLSGAVYAYFAVDLAYGSPCDAPLLAYIVSVGVLSCVLLLLRTAVVAVGIDEKPSGTMRFLLLYPVLVHGVEMMMAAAAGVYILWPTRHCALPLSAAYVNWTFVLMVCSWLVAGLIYPLSFDTAPHRRTQWDHPASGRVHPESAAPLFLRDLHGCVLVYRTVFGLGCVATFVCVRGDLPIGDVSLRDGDACTEPLVLWLIVELCFHLISWSLTLYYSSRTLLAPQLDVTLHEKLYWVFLLGVQLPSAWCGIALVHGEEPPCDSEASTVAYMARTGATLAACCLLGAVCLAPCWLSQVRARREYVKRGQHQVRSVRAERNASGQYAVIPTPGPGNYR